MGTKEVLIENLKNKGVLQTPSIIEAFEEIEREDFVSPGMEDHAYYNIPLPIGKGKTISQPLTVAFMLELLQPHFGDKVLDIGAGSGWITALIAHIVAERPEGMSKTIKPGKVVGMEIIPKLKEFGEENLSKYKFLQEGVVDVRCESACKGCAEEAPFDRIISAAAPEEVPEEWKEQLSPGGFIVTPVGSHMVVLHQKDKGAWEEREYPGFTFVPLEDR